MSDRTIHFYTKFAIKTLPCAAVTNADIGSFKFHHTLFDTYLDHASEIGTKSYDPKCTFFKVFFFFFDKKKPPIFKAIFDKALSSFCKTFLQMEQLFNGKLLIFRLPSFGVPKVMVVQHV